MNPAALRRFLPLAFAALMAAEIVVVSRAASISGHAGVLGAALAADMVLLSAIAVALAGGPKALGLTRQRVVRLATVALIAFVAALRLVHAERGPVLLALGGAAEVALVVAVIQAMRASGARGLRSALEERMPAPVARLTFAEIGVLLAAARALLRRPIEVEPPSATVFRPMTATSSGFFLPFVILASAVELPAVHLLLAHFAPGHTTLHLVLAGLTIYGVLWLLGERRLMQETAHRFTADALELELGARFRATIPFSKITKVVPLANDLDRRRVQATKGPKNGRATPLDAPNVHLCLSETIEYETLLGLKRRAQHLDVFVDRPAEFVKAAQVGISARSKDQLKGASSESASAANVKT